jgi:hypothetical protein
MADRGRAISDMRRGDRGALGALDERDRLEQLRAKLQVGIDQANRGKSVDWTPESREQIRRSARRRVKRGEKPDPDVCP